MLISSLLGVAVATLAAACLMLCCILITAGKLEDRMARRYKLQLGAAVFLCSLMFIWFVGYFWNQLFEVDPEWAKGAAVWLGFGFGFRILLLIVDGRLRTVDFRSPNAPDPADLFGAIVLSVFGPLHILFPS